MSRRRMFLAIVIILVCAFSAAALEFTPVTIDEGTHQGYMPSMVMDAEGNTHIVSLADDLKTLKYSHLDGSDWDVQTVDTCESAEYFYLPSLAIDVDGGVHISYYIGDNRNDLLYAYFDGQNWVRETVDTSGDAGRYSSIAIDSEGDPCIGYGVEDTFEIRFASRKDGAWSAEMVTSDDSLLYYPSMVLDSLDRPHFLYISQEEDIYYHLNYLKYEGEGSVPRQVDREEVWGSMPSLVLDQDDHPHIIYLERESGSMEYAFVSGDQLAYIPVTDDDARIESTRSIVIDDESKVHVCYLVRSFNGFPNTRYAVLENGSWASADIGSQGYDGFSSIALTPEGDPVVCYTDSMNSDLCLSYLEADEWINTTVSPSGARIGYVPLMRLDQEDNPHVLYCDYPNSHISYASYDGKSWNIKKTELGSSFIDMPALGSSEDGVPYAAFTEINFELADRISLKFGILSGDEWALEEITPMGIYPSLEVGRNGNPGVCFTSLDGFSDSGLEKSAISQMELYYASKRDGSWKIDQVTSEDISVDDKDVFCLDLVNDPNDVPSICYVEALYMMEGTEEYKFKYAVSTDQGWQMETISSDVYVNAAVMAFDNKQTLNIAFVATSVESNMRVATAKETEVNITEEPYIHALYYASRVGGEWIIEKVKELGEDLYRAQLSLVFDNLNNPHITYPSGTAGLAYAYNDGEDWHTALLGQGIMDSYGSHSSLALDSTGMPQVAYFTGDSLNYGKVRPSSSGGGCRLGIIAPSAALLLLPLFLLKKN